MAILRQLRSIIRWTEWHDSKLPLFLVTAYYLSARSEQGPEAGRIALLLVLLMIVAAFGYVINDFADWDADRLAEKTASATSRRTVGRVAVALLAGLPVLGIIISRSIWFWLALGMLCFFAASYSLRPLRFKERGWSGVVVGAAAQRVLPLFVIFTIYPSDWAAFILLVAHSLFVGLRWMLIHQWKDVDADSRSATTTYVVQSGRSKTLFRLRKAFVLECAVLLCLLGMMTARIPVLLPGWACYAMLHIVLWPVWKRIGWQQALTSYTRAPLADFYGLYWPLILAIYLVTLSPGLVVFPILEVFWKQSYWRSTHGMLWRRFHLQTLSRQA